jgi:hypothetical protein
MLGRRSHVYAGSTPTAGDEIVVAPPQRYGDEGECTFHCLSVVAPCGCAER